MADGAALATSDLDMRVITAAGTLEFDSGNNDQAFAWLDKAYEERSEYLVYLPTEPMADPLRNDPRFPALLKRLGLKK